MSHGRIVDFSQPGATGAKEFRRVEQHKGGRLEIMDKNSRQQAQPVELRVHEEVIIEGQGNVRLKKNGTPDMRFRNAPNAKEWDKIKRGDWESK